MSGILDSKAAQGIRLACFAIVGAGVVGTLVATVGSTLTEIPAQTLGISAQGLFLVALAVSLYLAEESALTAFGRWQTGTLVLLAITVVAFATGTVAGQLGTTFGLIGLALGAVGAFLAYSYLQYGRRKPAGAA